MGISAHDALHVRPAWEVELYLEHLPERVLFSHTDPDDHEDLPVVDSPFQVVPDQLAALPLPD